jgi:hypothetical protein
MSTKRNKNLLKRDQALNDATSGQLGEEPRPEPLRGAGQYESETANNIRNSRIRTARKISRDM